MTDYMDILDEDEVTEGETTPTPEASAAPAPEPEPEPAPEPEAVAEAPPEASAQPDVALPEGYKLDAQGRMHGPDGRVIKKEDAERILAEAKTPAPVPEPVAPVPPPTPEPAPAPVVPEPFVVRVNGQRIPIEGLTVAPEHQERIRNLIVNGLNHQQNFPRMQAENKQALAAKDALVEATKAKYNNASVYLFDKVAALLAENPSELEMVRRELALMLKEADLTVPRVADAEQGAEIDMEPAARATLNSYLAELIEDTPDAGKYFSEQDRKELADAFQARLNAYFDEQNGEIVLDTHAAKRDFDRELRIQQRAHQAREDAARDAQKAKAAAAFNAANAGQPGGAKPPVASKPKPVPVTVPSGVQTKGWDQRIADIWKDEDED